MSNKPRVLQIPLPGGSGEAPTGAVQFQNDWPGLFIRGDDAIDLLSKIRGLQQRLAGHPDVVVAAALMRLEEVAVLIERDVMMRSEEP
jgi:hypothetical protein